MASIFNNALLVVIAADAADPYVGFLGPRQAEYRRCTVPNVGDDDSISWRLACPHMTWSEFNSSAISLRAWTFQERLMARRAMIFTRVAWRWACAAGTSCECRSQRMYLNGLGAYSELSFSADLSEMQRATQSVPRVKLNEIWKDIVTQYSPRLLSYPKDRLPAISALATCFDSIQGDRYLAGLWGHDLISQLAWYPRYASPEPMWRLGMTFQPKPDYVAPSWSWASCQSGVEFPDAYARQQLQGTYYAKVLHAYCTPKSARNPFGEVIAGRLTLEGYNASCTITVDSISDRKPDKLTIRVGDGLPVLVSYKERRRLARGVMEFYMRRDPGQPESRSLYIGERDYNPFPKSVMGHLLWLSEAWCLLLAACVDSEAEYERVECMGLAWENDRWIAKHRHIGDVPGIAYGKIDII